jgi:hypothetical protein
MFYYLIKLKILGAPPPACAKAMAGRSAAAILSVSA